ncbi:hypothetical protein [Actinoplanes sp. NPDC026619]|uniref:hypothetical protein n=1 Tax=Actinoplanes sp. NPDC026619 TaxID=3155798 RepID=UPI0033CC15C2
MNEPTPEATPAPIAEPAAFTAAPAPRRWRRIGGIPALVIAGTLLIGGLAGGGAAVAVFALADQGDGGHSAGRGESGHDGRGDKSDGKGGRSGDRDGGRSDDDRNGSTPSTSPSSSAPVATPSASAS